MAAVLPENLSTYRYIDVPGGRLTFNIQWNKDRPTAGGYHVEDGPILGGAQVFFPMVGGHNDIATASQDGTISTFTTKPTDMYLVNKAKLTRVVIHNTVGVLQYDRATDKIGFKSSSPDGKANYQTTGPDGKYALLDSEPVPA